MNLNNFTTVTDPKYQVQDGDIVMCGKRKVAKVIYPGGDTATYELTVDESTTREERLQQMADLYNFLWNSRPEKEKRDE